MQAQRGLAVVVAAAPVETSLRLRGRLAGLERPFVVAADAGARTALALGLVPDVVVGDFDSLDAATLAALEAQQIRIERHPRDKDATDGQLAIERALETRPARLLLVGFWGGPRLDQAVASVLLLERLLVPTTLLDGANECQLLRDGEAVAWAPLAGEIVSLLPLSEVVTGVRTHGLRWPLEGAALHRGSTRGVSNEPVAGRVQVAIGHGRLLLTRHFPEGWGMRDEG